MKIKSSQYFLPCSNSRVVCVSQQLLRLICVFTWFYNERQDTHRVSQIQQKGKNKRRNSDGRKKDELRKPTQQ